MVLRDGQESSHSGREREEEEKEEEEREEEGERQDTKSNRLME